MQSPPRQVVTANHTPHNHNHTREMPEHPPDNQLTTANPDMRRSIERFIADGPEGDGSKPFSRRAAAKAIGVNPTYLTRYLSGGDGGVNFDVAKFEQNADAGMMIYARRATLKSERLFKTPLFRQFALGCEMAESVGGISLLHSAAGWGKTSAKTIYLSENPKAVGFTFNQLERNDSAFLRLLRAAGSSRGYRYGMSNWAFLVGKYEGTGSPILADNCHRMTPACRRSVMDFHDATGCPIVLIGNPEIIDVMRADAGNGDGQQVSRLSYQRRLEIPDEELPPVVEQMVRAAEPTWARNAGIMDFLNEVALGTGHLRAVATHIRFARFLISKDPALSASGALDVAAAQLITTPNDEG